MVVEKILTYRSFSIRIDRHSKHYKWCRVVCTEARSFIDQATYIRRQNFFNGQKTGIYRSEKELSQEFRDGVDRLKLGHTQITTTLWNRTKHQWNGFYGSIKKKIKANLPQYLKKKGTKYGSVEYHIGQNNSPARINDKWIYFNGTHKNKIKFNHFIDGVVRSVIITFKNNSFWVTINYKVEETQNKNDPSRIASIDIGINNLLTVSFNTGHKPVIVSGNEIKSVNQFYNKQKAKAQSELPAGIKWSNRLNLLTEKRNLKIKDIKHVLTKILSKILNQHRIGTLVIGWNVGFKSEVNIGKVNNQKFISIPYRAIVDCLKYKCQSFLEVIETEESYTSKASFFDQDQIPVYVKDSISNYKFSGKRIKRGLYKTATGRFVNADVNGSYNIMRKVFPNVVRENKHGIEGLAFDPIRTKNSYELNLILQETTNDV